MTTIEKTHCGFIALVGRPNVGKSTLMNRMIGQKISITSDKPQTTRHRLLGIKTEDNYQYIFVDTPGLHKDMPKAINRYLNKAAHAVLADVDIVVFMVDATQWTDEDDFVRDKLIKMQIKPIVVLNKVDLVSDKDRLLPLIEALQSSLSPQAIVPVSAKNGTQVEYLAQMFKEQLPQAPLFYPKDAITDRSERFLCAELLREKLVRLTGQELPYSSSVVIESFKEEEKLFKISALIYVEREGQKKIIIGKQGEKLKKIGQQARLDMETLLGKKVFLQIWVKIRKGWADDERMLQSFGYGD